MKKPAPGGARRVSLGTIPEFGFEGEGVLLSGVVEGSPAEAASLRAGDLLLGLNGAPIGDLRAYSDALKTLVPGQRVLLRVRRDGKEIEVALTAAAR